MSDIKSAPAMDLLSTSMDHIARQIGEMNPDDPKRAERVKELFNLKELGRLLESQTDQTMYSKLNELAREAAKLKPGDPRHNQLIREILRLSGLISN